MPKNTSKILIPLATATVAAAVTIGSGATWTAKVPTTTIATAGILKMDHANGAQMEISNMKPGDTRTGTLKITNTGSVEANIALTEQEQTVTNAFVAHDLQIQISKDGTQIYPAAGQGTFGDFGVIGANMTVPGTLKAADPTSSNDETTFTFVVKLVGDDPKDQGASEKVNYDFIFTPVKGDPGTGTFTDLPSPSPTLN